MTVEKQGPGVEETELEVLIRDLELIDHNSPPREESGDRSQGGGPDDGDSLG